MAATLIVGLGGMGSRVVRKIADRAESEGLNDVEFVVMDTDVNDLRTIREANPRIYTVQTSPNGTVGAALDQNDFARKLWFPINDGLTGKPFTEGAGQVRAVSRLAFDHAVTQGYMAELEKAIEKLHGISGESLRQEMRIMIVGSNNGGTGSGLVLPVAMYIRNFLITRYQDNSAIIRGFFLEPDTIFDRITDEEERNSLRCNAYATIRELDAFFRKEFSGESPEFRHVVFNAPQPGSGERVDYPNILPYHFVFLMDAINSEGEHLPTHDAYLDHAAESIYAQALSAVAARSNSSEDNIIRNLAANNGRSRYCGAGSAYLEYPMATVQRYLGLKWASQNISTEWLEIDADFNQRHREDESLKLSEEYQRAFGSKMTNVPFYRKISKGVTLTYEGDNGLTTTVEPAREYADQVIDHADAVNNGELLRYCAALSRALSSRNIGPIPATPEAIEEVVANNGDNAANILGNRYDSFLSAVLAYNQAVTEEMEGVARHLAQNAFAISDFNEDPLGTNGADWQFESLARVEFAGGSGAKHPGAMRYMLYCAADSLAEAIDECVTEIEMQDVRIKSLQRNLEDDDELEPTAEKRSKPKIKLPFIGKEGIDADTMAKLSEEAEMLNKMKKAVDKRREALVRKAFLVEAKNYVDGLSGAYEAFYSFLGSQIDSIESEINAIEHDGRFNATKGETRKYICANTQCLKAIDEECPVKGDSADLPADLCADIYTRLLRYSKMNKNSDRRLRSADLKIQAFRELFQSTVVDYWVERVLDPQNGYPEKVDRDIIKAIVAEAAYLNPDLFFDQTASTRYAESYISDMLDQAYHLAAPFIEPPVGEMPRTFKTCAYASSILEGANAYYGVLTRKFGELNATPIENYSKYSIMFYRSMYGFCATNLPKYAPERDGIQHMPEGEYHHAYFSLVSQLSPNLRENKLITPHIDKNWHLVTALPDLNEDHERLINREIVHSFLFGLVFQQFGSEQVSTGDDVFYLKSTRVQPRVELWVSNGTPCDRFYEVFDALKYNPRAVKMLIERSRDRMRREIDDARGGTSVDRSHLVRVVRSRAFERGGFDSALAGEEIVKRIMLLDDSAAREMFRLEAGDEETLNSSLVRDMFNAGDNSMPRRSMLEIPLFYQLSLPSSELRAAEIDLMLDSIFSVVTNHFSNFCDQANLDDMCGRFFEEQYLLFEHNLVLRELEFPGIYSNRTVGAVREKTLSFMESVGSRFDRMSELQNRIDRAWREYRRL